MTFRNNATGGESSLVRIKNRSAQRGGVPERLLAILVALAIALGVSTTLIVVVTEKVRNAREAEWRIWRLSQPDVEQTWGTLDSKVMMRTVTHSSGPAKRTYEFEYYYKVRGLKYRGLGSLYDAPENQFLVTYAPDMPSLSQITGHPEEAPYKDFWVVLVVMVIPMLLVGFIRFYIEMSKDREMREMIGKLKRRFSRRPSDDSA